MPGPAWTFFPKRVALVAGVKTPVRPPIICANVAIGNATPDDLRVYQDSNDETTYFIVPAGYEKEIELASNKFMPFQDAFYLQASLSGDAVLIWK